MYRLLIAEDEPIIAEGLLNTFPWSSLGFTVVGMAEDGIVAQLLLELHRPDVLLTDIRMPGADGLELLWMAKQLCPQTEVVLLTAYAQFEYARKAVNSGAFRYILKDDMDVELEKTFRELAQRLDHARPALPAQGVEMAANGDNMLLRARDYIDLHYTEELNLNDIAAMFFFNPTYFSRAFKQRMSIGFLDYIRRRRMILARYLLLTTDLPITEIAGQVGYGDSKHFSDLFKREFGMTAASMRRNSM